MLNPDLNLNPNLFDDDVEMEPTRNGYGSGLILAGEANENVVALTADLSESTRTDAFAKKFPKRFFEVGVAEQGMVTIASGLSAAGKIPFVASYATFCPGRTLEQIRTTICYNNANVKIAGHHAGLSVGPDGATHQALEDVAIMRALPNMRVIVPCDALEAERATCAASTLWGPVYLRFSREKTRVLTTKDTPFIPGKADAFYWTDRPRVLVLGTGPVLYSALCAAKELEKQKIGVIVLNVHTIKPLDTTKIIELAGRIRAVVTVEEHQVAGGLGGVVAELLSEKCPVPLERVGVEDRFGESGKPEELLRRHGIDTAGVISAIKRVLKRKDR